MSLDDPWRDVWSDRTADRADWNGYEACFATPEQYQEFVQASARFVQDILEPSLNDTVLDLGCGTGRVTEILAKEVREMTGVDYSPIALDIARSRAGENTRYVRADLNSCSGEILTGYSKAFAFGSLMYLRSLDRAFEIMDILTSAGTDLLVLDLPDASIADERPREYSRERYQHLRFDRQVLLGRFPGATIYSAVFPQYVNSSHRFAALIPAR